MPIRLKWRPNTVVQRYNVLPTRNTSRSRFQYGITHDSQIHLQCSWTLNIQCSLFMEHSMFLLRYEQCGREVSCKIKTYWRHKISPMPSYLTECHHTTSNVWRSDVSFFRCNMEEGQQLHITPTWVSEQRTTAYDPGEKRGKIEKGDKEDRERKST